MKYGPIVRVPMLLLCCFHYVVTGATLSPISKNVSADSGFYDVSVVPDGAWGVDEDADWISTYILSPTVVRVVYDSNSSPFPRDYEVAIAGVSHTISQAGVSPALIPESSSVWSGSGQYQITVYNEGYWVVDESLDFLTVEPSSGFGEGTITVFYDANGSYGRSGSFTVGGVEHRFSQTKAPALTPDSVDLSAGTKIFVVGIDYSGAGFGVDTSWSVADLPDWLQVHSTTTGQIGPDSVAIQAASNTTGRPRLATIRIGGRELVVEQSSDLHGDDFDSATLIEPGLPVSGNFNSPINDWDFFYFFLSERSSVRISAGENTITERDKTPAVLMDENERQIAAGPIASPSGAISADLDAGLYYLWFSSNNEPGEYILRVEASPVNPPAQIVESAGLVDLLKGESGYFIGSESRPLLYNGSQVAANIDGWSPVGVEAAQGGGYDLVWKKGSSYVISKISAGGIFLSYSVLSTAELRALELSFDQDINGDGELGDPPAQIVESAGLVDLLKGESGYFIGSESRPLLYNGFQVATHIDGWSPVGVEATQGSGYDLVWKKGNSYVISKISAGGIFLSYSVLSAVELRALELSFDQDINGDGYVGSNPNLLAPQALPAGTIIEDSEVVSFFSSGNTYFSFYKDLSEVNSGSFTYSRISGNVGQFKDGPGTWLSTDGLGNYAAETYTATFISPTEGSYSFPNGNESFELVSAENTAPEYIVGVSIRTFGSGYNRLDGGRFNATSRIEILDGNNGTYYGDEAVSFRYTYQKVGPRELRVNAVGRSAFYNADFRVSFYLFFVTPTSGYSVAIGDLGNGALIDYEWGTFSVE